MTDRTLDTDPARTGTVAALPATFTLSWWDRGGEPGSPSDKIDIDVSVAGATGVYTKARFDPAYEPPYLAEDFAGAVPTVLIDRMRAALQAEGAFRRRFDSEGHSELRDAVKSTLNLRWNGGAVEKTLFESPPSELAESKAIRNEIARHLVRTGTHRILSKRKL